MWSIDASDGRGGCRSWWVEGFEGEYEDGVVG